MNDSQPRPKRALPPEDAFDHVFDDRFGSVFRPEPPTVGRRADAVDGDAPASDAPDATPTDNTATDDAPAAPAAPDDYDAPEVHRDPVVPPDGPSGPDTPDGDAGDPDDGGRGSLRRSILLTALSTVLPGAGLLGARPVAAKVVGAVVPLAFLATIAVIATSALTDLGSFAGFAVDPAQLQRLSFVLIGIGLVWVALIAATHLLTRPRHLGSSRRMTGAVLVTVFSLVVAAPVAVAARYSHDQQKLVQTVFQDDDKVQSTSRPTIDAEVENPWEGHPRLNILLLGADGNAVRNTEFGIRTDTIMLASIDTATGELTIVQIPRNVQYTPFPEGSDMAEAFPRGFRGEGDSQEWMVNNIWNTVEMNPWYSDLFEGQTYRGAEALKQGVEGITGLKVDYFVLLNIDGIQRLIDAMGGVRVNINDRLPMGRETSRGPSGGWLEPGPDQKLNGYEGMWYARSRSRSSDYDRMARQSCLVDAIIKQANPGTMLTSYEAIAAAGAEMVMTDIPQQVLQPVVQLSLKVKDADVERLVFSPGKNGYDFNNPDFEQMRAAVEDAIAADEPAPSTPAPATSAPPVTSAPPTTEAPSAEPSASPSSAPTFVEGSQSVTDACAYHGE